MKIRKIGPDAPLQFRAEFPVLIQEILHGSNRGGAIGVKSFFLTFILTGFLFVAERGNNRSITGDHTGYFRDVPDQRPPGHNIQPVRIANTVLTFARLLGAAV